MDARAVCSTTVSEVAVDEREQRTANVSLVAAHSSIVVFAAGASVGLLGGLIGLGGAEFRLPLLIGIFGVAALQAVILNKAMSLAVVLTALPARLVAIPAASLLTNWSVAANLLAGSLAGAWAGASWATSMRSVTLYRVLAGLLVLMAGALVWSHFGAELAVALDPVPQAFAGLLAGFAIGLVAAVMGVAGGELLIPTIVCCTPWTSSSRAACHWWCRYPRCSSRSLGTAGTKASSSSAVTSASSSS